MKITKEQYDALPDSVKALFKADGDEYSQITHPDPSDELKRAKDREVEARKAADAKANDLQTQLDKINGDKARKAGDIETLEKSWQSKLDAQKAEYEASLTKANEFIQKTLVDSVAASMASEISTSPAVMLPHIKSRLTADLDGDTPITKVLDASGNASALNLDDLKKEFVANKDFASIIVGSKASGSVTADGQKGNRVDTSDVNLAKMKPGELLEHMRAVKEQTQE